MVNTAYFADIWQARYFWLHLALADIRCKYRRSMLGITWAILQPFCLTLLFAFVMSHIFHVPMHDYALYIYSGLIIWEFIVSVIMSGCMAFINAEGYIKQFRHPLLIYSLRCTLASLINLLFASIGLIIWILLENPLHAGLSWLTLFASYSLLLLFAWPLASLMAFIGVRFRDFSQVMILVLQAIYFISPILFLPAIFKANGMSYLFSWNPLYYLLNLFRMPLLQGVVPAFTDYVIVLMVSIALWICLALFVRRHEHQVIFYL